MIKKNAIYLWQMPCSIDAQEFCASVPASLSRTQSEFGLACANEMSASKQNSPPSANAQAACCFTQLPSVCKTLLKPTAFLLQHWERFVAPQFPVCGQLQLYLHPHCFFRSRVGFFHFEKHHPVDFPSTN